MLVITKESLDLPVVHHHLTRSTHLEVVEVEKLLEDQTLILDLDSLVVLAAAEAAVLLVELVELLVLFLILVVLI